MLRERHTRTTVGHCLASRVPLGMFLICRCALPAALVCGLLVAVGHLPDASADDGAFGDGFEVPEALPFTLPKFTHLKIGRKEIGQPLVDGKFVRVEMGTVDYSTEVRLSCWVLASTEPTEMYRTDSRDSRSEMIIQPDFYTWTVRDKQGQIIRSWWAYFYFSEAGMLSTEVRMPLDELRQSELTLYFNDINRDGIQDAVKITVDMSKFDWRRSGSEFEYRTQRLASEPGQ